VNNDTGSSTAVKLKDNSKTTANGFGTSTAPRYRVRASKKPSWFRPCSLGGLDLIPAVDPDRTGTKLCFKSRRKGCPGFHLFRTLWRPLQTSLSCFSLSVLAERSNSPCLLQLVSAPANAAKVQQPAAAAKQAQQAAPESAGGGDPGIDDDLQVRCRSPSFSNLGASCQSFG
jgi:hypothetical protein